MTTAKATFKEFREDDLQGWSARVSYNILFSIVPLMIFFTALSGFVARAVGSDDTMDRVTEWLFNNMGTNEANTVRDPIQRVVEGNNGGLLSVGAVLALWGGKNAVAAVMKALNATFDIEEGRGFIKRNLVAMGLTVALGIAITLVSAVFLAGAAFAESALDRIGLGETWQTAWQYLRWPVIVAILIVAVALFYWAAPNRDAPFKYLTPGSVLAVIGWGLATVGIGFYFANFAGYAGGTYGALGGVLAFIFWVNLMILILLIGAELDSVLLKQKGVVAVESEPAQGRARTHHPSVSPFPAFQSSAPGFVPTTAVAGASSIPPTPASTHDVSSVPRGTSQFSSGSSGKRTASAKKKQQSTRLLSITMGFAKFLIRVRRMLKRFSGSKKR